MEGPVLKLRQTHSLTLTEVLEESCILTLGLTLRPPPASWPLRRASPFPPCPDSPLPHAIVPSVVFQSS